MDNMDYLLKAKTILTNVNTHLNDIKYSYLEFMELIKDYHINEKYKPLHELEQDFEFNYLKMLIKETQEKITNNHLQIDHFNKIINEQCNKFTQNLFL
jgi:predicted RNA-binding protein with EMAP domain